MLGMGNTCNTTMCFIAARRNSSEDSLETRPLALCAVVLSNDSCCLTLIKLSSCWGWGNWLIGDRTSDVWGD